MCSLNAWTATQMGFRKRTTATLFYRVHNWLSKVQIPRNVGDFRLLDRSVLEALKQLPERQRFMKGLFAWVGFNTVTVAYSRDPRNAGSTKYTWWSLLNHALEGLTSFSTEPLRLCAYAGGITAVATLVYAGSHPDAHLNPGRRSTRLCFHTRSDLVSRQHAAPRHWRRRRVCGTDLYGDQAAPDVSRAKAT